MTISDQLVSRMLGSTLTNQSGTHYISDCPFCGKEDHLYVQRKTDRTNIRGKNVSFFWHCKKCSEGGTIFSLAKKLGKFGLVAGEPDVDSRKFLEKKINVSVEDAEPEGVVKKTIPLGFRRLIKSNYLTARGFTEKQFRKYQVGRTKLISSLEGYLIFLIEDGGVACGWVARSKMDKEWIDAYNKKVTTRNENRVPGERKRQKYLRYKNSSGTDFAKLLMGIDEVTENTTKVILVEGVFDKFKVESLLDLDGSEKCKCLCTFGKNVSEYQSKKMADRGVQEIVVLYDPDAVNSSKKYGAILRGQFDTKIGFLKNKDPGDLNLDELLLVLGTAQDPLSFSINRVQKQIVQ